MSMGRSLVSSVGAPQAPISFGDPPRNFTDDTSDVGLLTTNRHNNTARMRSALIFLLLFILSSAESIDCPLPCQNRGVCKVQENTDKNGTIYHTFSCNCDYQYDGPICDTPWGDEPRFMTFVNIYASFTIIINFLLIVWVGYEVYKHGIKYWSGYTVVSYSLSLVAFGALLRVITFAIDPHTIRRIIPRIPYQILFTLSQIVWFSSGFGLCVYWIELAVTSRSRVGLHVKRFRHLFRALVALSYILLLPTCIWIAISNDLPSIVAYDICALLLLFTFVGITVFFGSKLYTIIEDSEKLNKLRSFLRKIVVHMAAIVLVLIGVVVSLVVYLFYAKNKWWFIGIHWTIRVEEFLLCLSVIHILSRKRPDRIETSTELSLQTRSNTRLLLFSCLVAYCACDEVRIIPSIQYGVWEGWGASLAWWGKQFGDRDDFADLFFTMDQVNITNGADSWVLPGLGFNIVRYNAGATSHKPYDGKSMSESWLIPPERQIDALWVDWGSQDPSSSSWNWTRDANQRDMLLKAKKRGANLFELFSNSPVWWQCKDLNPSGGLFGLSNLDESHRDDHAIYLATIARYFKDNFGLEFTSVDAFNEPSNHFWLAVGNQEGCHFDILEMADVIIRLRKQLDRLGMNDTIVSAADENTYDYARFTWTQTPSNEQMGGDRGALYNAVNGKKLWNTEYGDGDGSGMSMAAALNMDLLSLHPTAWCYWQPIDSAQGWGLFWGDIGNKTLFGPSDKHYVMAHYTRHIRPGMQIMNAGFSGSSAAAYDAKENKLVIVSFNNDKEQAGFTFDLSLFSKVNATANVWSTTVGGEKYAQMQKTVKGTILLDVLPSQSIRTYEITAFV
ncbi:endo-beta-1,6-galactanase [Planoprotostelium fungivorum]|uniref:Endo-beta-1,6-galactanase n=1 Tax=Planoprotostelium fungivorum TaxID=1890364 RepID=A0A2P6NG71_9EUKA|nr:endo-beta-1,6-galactanase [Planoprotostelium fungivorum]